MASEALDDKAKPQDEAPVKYPKPEVAFKEEAPPAEVVEKEEEHPEKENEDPEEEKNVDEAEEVAKEVEEKEGEGKKRARKRTTKKEVTEFKDDNGESEEVTPEKKEPVTPTSERPTRERKIVERYSAPSTGRSTASKVLSIEKGRGTQLKDIPNVSFKLSKRKADDNLQVLHTILFGKKAKAHSLKRNIGQFSGFVWAENEEKQKSKVREKLDKCVKEKLVDFCDVLNIQINKTSVKKEEVSAKLLEFLESPHATTDILLADKEQKVKKRRRVAAGKNVSPGEASEDTPAKKQKTPQGGKKRKQFSKSEDEVDKAESPEAKDESHEDDENDATPKEESDHLESKSDKEEDEDEEVEPEKPVSSKSASKKSRKETSGAKSKGKSKVVKKSNPEKSVKSPTKPPKKSSSSTSKMVATNPDATPDSHSKSKGSSSKKQKVEKESPKSQGKEKTTGRKQSIKSPSKNSANLLDKDKSSKKSKLGPTREEMLTVVTAILKEVDFNTATLSDILRQLGTHFGVDLMHRKAEVKDIITEVINDMSDEEEESDDAEGGGDDGDEDDNA